MTSSSKAAVEGRDVAKTSLPNGLKVLTERMPHVRSVAFGVWVDRGSRHETPDDNGISHFTEHMVFKGTETRSAEDIAFAIDGIGGHLDAFTTKENIAFTAKVLDEHLPTALDVVSDMTLRPSLREVDVEKEKGVVLEELKMDEDNPDYLLHELFVSNYWRDHPLGRPIIGTKETIRAFNSDQLRRFFTGTFAADNVLVTAAGNLDHDAFAAQVAERFDELRPTADGAVQTPPAARPTIVLRDKPSLEQVHVCVGLEALPMADPRRFAAYVLSNLLGGGFSSRLFLKIREQAGLAYAVYSDLNLYADGGYMTVYAGTSRDAASEVLGYVTREFRDVKDNLVGEVELRRAKDHLKGSLMLSLESTSSRMSNLARQEKYFRRIFSLDEVVESIENVTAQQLRDLAVEWLRPERLALTILGPLDGLRVERDQLAC